MVTGNGGGIATGGRQNPSDDNGRRALMWTQSMVLTTTHGGVEGGRSQGVYGADDISAMTNREGDERWWGKKGIDPRAYTESQWSKGASEAELDC